MKLTKSSFIAAVLLLFSFSGFAQDKTTGTIKGKVRVADVPGSMDWFGRRPKWMQIGPMKTSIREGKIQNAIAKNQV